MDFVEGGLVAGEVLFVSGFLADEGDLFHPASETLHFVLTEATSGDGGSAETDAGWTEGATFVSGEGIGIQGEADEIESSLVEFAVDTKAGFGINKDEVIIGAAALEDKAGILECGSEGFGVVNNLGGVIFEFWL